MKENEIIEVDITEVNPGYILVNYEGAKATLQITELTWKPGPVDPNDYVSVGDKVTVKVMKVVGDQFSISLRETLPGGNPWNNPPKVGEIYNGKVALITEYGFFFDITDYCRALLHIDDAEKTYKMGESETLVVKSVDLSLHKVGLSVGH